MAREIELISETEGVHYLLFGLDSNELSSFAIQMWLTKYGKRGIDWAQSMGMGFITFMGGDLWVHNSGTADRCNLFGEQRDCIVGVVANANDQTSDIRLYDALHIHSNDEWEVTEVVIPATLNYPNGMFSKIPKERFKKRDGVWRAEFLRNMKSTDDTIKVINAIKGEPLRGDCCYMLLKNTNTEQVKLFKVDVLQSTSRV